MNKYCYLCGTEITKENDTKEHIIPNALGGRKKVSGFICRNCNSNTGQTWDNELAKQFENIATFMGIKRERGTPPPVRLTTLDGKDITLHADSAITLSKPIFSKEEDPEGTIKISLTARSETEANQKIKEMKKKYGDRITSTSVERKREYLNTPINLSPSKGFGGHNTGKSIIKSLLSLAAYNKIDYYKFENADEYLKQGRDACWDYFYSKDFIVDRPHGIPLTCVSIKLNSENKLAIGYIEYFCFFRAIALLSENYTGKSKTITYAINPLTGEDLNIQINIDIEKIDIVNTFNSEHFPTEDLIKTFDLFMPEIIEKQREEEKSRVLKRAIDEAFKNCGAKEGEILTLDHLHKIAHDATEGIMPWILHQLNDPFKK
jgi:hypothetical protein